jgi:hypothetical protein
MKKVMFTAFALGLCLTANLMAQPNYVPTNGLVGWWPFNGNADDESGNGNNGTVNGATLTADRFGNSNKAYSFDGVNDFIQSPNQTLTGSVSFSGWYQMSDFDTPGNDMFYISNQSTTNDIYSSNIAFGFRSYQGQYGHSTYVASPLTGYYATNNLPIENVWHHITCVFENGSYVKMYLDNILIYSNNNVATSLSQASLPLLFGGTGTSSFYYYLGQLDDIGIWNRALTEQEIANLYNGCSNTSITSQPANTIANPTTAAQFSIAASNVTSCQWQTDLGVGFQNVSNAGQFSGATNDTLTVSNVSTTNNNQQFRCIINSNGCVDTSTVAVLSVSTNGINELISQKNFAIFPNPAKTNFEIKTDLAYDKIEILDIQGRLVQIERKNNMISISSLQKGTYIIRLLDEKSNVIGIQQLVKE